MTITNARIVLEDKIIHGTIEFNNQKIMRIQANKKVKADYDAKGLYLLPAFVDSHTHGGYGFDFNMLVNDHHHDAMNTYLQRIHEEGVGSVLLTTVTCDDHDLNQIAQNYKVIKAHDHHNLIKGWYIEGPYISTLRKGAHNPNLIRALDLNQLKRIHKVLPKVTKVLAIAPEFKKNLLKYPKISQDFLIATGHTDASYDMAMHAFDLGGKRVTHLYNAMPNFDKRHPTILNAIFNRCDLKCELICDGAHVNNHVILNTYNILDADQIMIISDSLLTKGLPDGEYQVWGIAVDKRGILDYLHGTESIAGGNLPYHKQVENFGKITQCSMNDLLKVSSLNAARSLKQDKAFGNLVVGAESSFVLLDKNYQLKATFIKGQKI